MHCTSSGCRVANLNAYATYRMMQSGQSTDRLVHMSSSINPVLVANLTYINRKARTTPSQHLYNIPTPWMVTPTPVRCGWMAHSHADHTKDQYCQLLDGMRREFYLYGISAGMPNLVPIGANLSTLVIYVWSQVIDPGGTEGLIGLHPTSKWSRTQ